MPAHIGVGGLARWTVAFLDQKTHLTHNGALHSLQHTTARGRELGATKYAVGISATANLAESNRARRERHCATYAEYRQKLDEINYGVGGATSNFAGYQSRKIDARDLVKGLKKEAQGKYRAPVPQNVRFDQAGHDAFKKEWEICLREGAAFDLVVEQLFDDGWRVILIMKKADHRLKQLKRIEGFKPGSSTPKILWSMS